MPKLCLLCGKRDDDGVWDTCPACGEGTWQQIDVELGPTNPEPAETPDEPEDSSGVAQSVEHDAVNVGDEGSTPSAGAKEDASGDAPSDSADAPGTEQEEPRPDAPILTCADCGKVAKSEAGLQAHRRAKHPQ